MTEDEVLDLIYESLPDEPTFDVSLYPSREGLPKPEMYVKIGNECWRIEAKRHRHPLEE